MCLGEYGGRWWPEAEIIPYRGLALSAGEKRSQDYLSSVRN